MYLYLKSGKWCQVVSEISLREGHQPVIGKTLPCQPGGQEPIPIEPALWYKVLLMDSLIIDCDSREVKWSRGVLSDNADGVLTSIREDDMYLSVVSDGALGFPSTLDFEESFGSDGAVYDFDSTDTLFLEVAKLLNDHQHKKVTDAELNLVVLRLLHCYILPQVVLNREDVPGLNSANEFIKKQLIIAEKAIDKASYRVVQLQNSLKEQREKFLTEFQSEELVRLYNSDFLLKLSRHMQRDIDKSTTVLEEVQDEVNQIKALCGEDCTDVPVLAEKRSDRDKAFQNLEKMKIVRENILNVVVRPPKTTRKSRRWRRGLKPGLLEYQEKYIKENRVLEEKHAEMQELYARKVKVLSVKEAIKETLSELRTDKESLGLQFKSDGSERATDILGSTVKPEEWMTLEEKVGNALSSSNTEVHDLHIKFCQLVKDKITAALDEMGILTLDGENHASNFGVENNFSEALDLAGLNAQKRRRSRSNSRLVQSLSMYGENGIFPLKYRCENLSKQIHEHIDRIISCLREHHKMSTNEGKLRMCYEGHIYPQIMPALSKLYNVTYEPLAKVLAKQLPTLTPQALDITDAWLLQLVECDTDGDCDSPQPESFLNSPYHACCCSHRQDVAEETEVKRPLSDSSEDEIVEDDKADATSKRLSYELSRHSLHALYERANQDGQQIVEELSSFEVIDVPDPYCLEDIEEGISCDSSPELLGHSKVEGQPCLCHLHASDSPPRYGFRMEFGPAIEHIRSIAGKPTVLSKLKQLTKAFRFVSRKVSELCTAGRGASKGTYMACCDDMLSVCILLLTYLSQEEVRAFYTNLNLMIDLMAPCLRNGVHDCTLINFHGAFQYVVDSQLIKKTAIHLRIHDGESAYTSA